MYQVFLGQKQASNDYYVMEEKKSKNYNPAASLFSSGINHFSLNVTKYNKKKKTGALKIVLESGSNISTLVRNIELATAEHYLVSMGVGDCGCLLVFLVWLGKEFKNELKKKFKDNFISLKEKHPRTGEL